MSSNPGQGSQFSASGGGASNKEPVGGESLPNPFTNNAPDLPPQLPGFGVASGGSKGISSHTALLLLVLLISAVAIFGMRKLGLGTLAALASVGAEKVDMSAVPKIDDSHKLVLAELSKTRTDNQVEKDQLQRNPFQQMFRPRPLNNAVAAPNMPVPKDDAEARQQARVSDLLIKLGGMQLNGIMGGLRPVARIDGRMYRVGETVAATFTVRAISGRQVQLEADGELFVLEMTGE